MYLLARRPSTPGRRSYAWVKHGPLPRPLHPRLAFGQRRTGGRGLTGLITVRTKGAGQAQGRLWRPAIISRGLFTLHVVAARQERTWGAGSLFLLRSAVGSWCCIPVTVGVVPGGYLQAVPPHLGPDFHIPFYWWRQLGAVDPYARVSYVPPYPGAAARFACSLGVTCRVLIPTLERGWALVALPSGQLSVLPTASYVQVGAAEPRALRWAPCATAGLARRRGRKPIVRGTVRNPNDHPHGGRTRAIKYPRTPWGRTAKYPRPTHPKLHLKALARRRPSAASRRIRPLPYWAEGSAVEPMEAEEILESGEAPDAGSRSA